MKSWEHNRPKCISDRVLLFQLRFTRGFACGLEFLQNVAPMFCPLLLHFPLDLLKESYGNVAVASQHHINRLLRLSGV